VHPWNINGNAYASANNRGPTGAGRVHFKSGRAGQTRLLPGDVGGQQTMGLWQPRQLNPLLQPEGLMTQLPEGVHIPCPQEEATAAAVQVFQPSPVRQTIRQRSGAASTQSFSSPALPHA
jgi:hypothetical protein